MVRGMSGHNVRKGRPGQARDSSAVLRRLQPPYPELGRGCSTVSCAGVSLERRWKNARVQKSPSETQ